MAASANGVALDAEEDPNEAVAEETVAEEAQEDPQDAYVRTLTRYVTDMRVIHPDLVRAIAAYQALQYLGAALRGGSDVRRLRRLHLKSKVTEKIDEFWSHSWQLKPYRKIFCLLFLKNGLASSIAGTLGALLAAFLMRAGVLPIKVLPFSHIPFWCTVFGVIFSAAALFLWRPQAKVFLDVCCINQVDSKKKAEGIVSLGGILKRSKSLFILWDPSYIERTWCVFEIAAFLHGCGARPRTVVRPTLLGPAALATYVGTPSMMLLWIFVHDFDDDLLLGVDFNICAMFAAFFLAFYWGVATFRSYYRSIQTFHHQLLNFRLQDTKCHCCTRGHISEDGSRMPCDREIVEGCLCNWFGSVQKFEEFIAPILRSTFENQLGQHQFPYSYFLVIFCPAAWLAMDLSVGAAEPGYIARYEKDYWSVFWFFQLLGIWLGTMPSISKLALYLTQCFCAPRRYLICDVLLNVMIVSLLNFCFYLFLHTTRFFNDKHNSPLNDLDISMTARAILMFVTWCLPAFLLFSMPEVLKLIRSRHKKRSSQDATQEGSI